ncbi:hypothetical protein GUITHDRAFT_135413 [Guillardia theta CCMP2712]|uniref:DUF1995 domain-containing protein n=1 Tax=Guillardia theta (strain CCMP2712) TaxID=905079 RepID=L1JNU5_GUITC|nr:hypothetical protein GUITHDRAFT_135413 [Guillardia theta CCMP2712]EKX50251.1 hypothetical protein GUITHDRAFT_135413 [Guillardia theta CCMP2712]|eukprot:XP_005837231.1 hypothetical protein GUITHDRAFT_135413 [Guillardia theta CCMP2712]
MLKLVVLLGAVATADAEIVRERDMRAGRGKAHGGGEEDFHLLRLSSYRNIHCLDALPAFVGLPDLSDLDSVGGHACQTVKACQQCRSAARSAILSGQRRIRADVLTPDFDMLSRAGYDEDAFHALCVQLLEEVGALVSQEIRVIFQSEESKEKALRFIESRKVQLLPCWVTDTSPATPVSLGKHRCSGLLEQQADQRGAVVLIAPSNFGGAKVTSQVRKILQNSETSVVLVLNQYLDALGPDGRSVGTLPYEMFTMHTAYYLQPFALQERAFYERERAVTSRPAASMVAKLLLLRQTPSDWAFMAFEPEDASYTTLKRFRTKPSEKTLLDICKEFVASRGKRRERQGSVNAKDAGLDVPMDDKPAEIDPQLLESLERMMREGRED